MTRFAIDFNDPNIYFQVNYKRGLLEPRNKISIKAHILGIISGDYYGEFWIRCGNPKRIIIKACIKSPCLKCIGPSMIREFAIIDFPRSYYGIVNHKYILVKNSSVLEGFFCVLANVIDGEYEFNEAKKIEEVYNKFDIYPTQGMLSPNELKIFQLRLFQIYAYIFKIAWFDLVLYNCRYLPVIPKGKLETSDHCLIKIVKLHCKLASERSVERNVSYQTISQITKTKFVTKRFKPYFQEDESYMAMSLPQDLNDQSDIVSIQLDNVMNLLLYACVEVCQVNNNFFFIKSINSFKINNINT